MASVSASSWVKHSTETKTQPADGERYMFVYRSRFLSRGEVWFDEEPVRTRVDWIFHRQRPSPLSECAWKYFYTPLIDLQKTPAELFGVLDEKTANRIAEAKEKDKLRCEHLDPKDPKLM